MGMIFFVPGDPVPQGSHIARKARDGRLFVVEEQGADLKRWRGFVWAAAFNQRAGAPALAGPVSVDLTFYIRRAGKGHGAERYVSVRGAGRGDVDKLARAVLDGLTQAGIFGDDSQVSRLVAEKLWADYPNPPGCAIIVSQIE